MARIAFLTWAGGGNVPPAIGIAQALVARGHQVSFWGYEAQRAQLERQGSPSSRSGGAAPSTSAARPATRASARS